jgi:hypothetical protein
VTMKNGVFLDVTPCGSFIKVRRIGELRKTLAVTSSWRKLRASVASYS